MTRPTTSARVLTISKYRMAFPPTRPAFLMLPEPAMPSTTLHRITGGMSILMRLMNPSASGCIFTATTG